MFVLEEERDALVSLSYQIAELAASKIEGFKHAFPFGQPKDDLKVNIKLLNLVRYVWTPCGGVWRCVRVCVSVCGFVYAHMCVLYTCTWMFYYYFNSF